MVLERLSISRGYSSDGPLRGEIKFKTGEDAEIKLVLDEQLASEIVSLCAEAVVRAGKAAADALTLDALNVSLIEHQEPVAQHATPVEQGQEDADT